jgi:hypothetical protein
MASDAPELIERAVRTVLEEVPALKTMKLIVGIDLHGRGDTQQFRLELPDLKITKDIAADSRVRVEMRREFFNAMVEHGARIVDWQRAFAEGRSKATGVEQYLQLIARVVERQQERAGLRRARGGAN